MVIAEDETGAGDAGCGVAAKGFSFELSIFGCHIFIARPSQPAPDAISCGDSGTEKAAPVSYPY